MRGYLNKPDMRMYAIFGFLLLPIASLCYHNNLSIGTISSIPFFLSLLVMLVASRIEIPFSQIRTKKPEHLKRDALALEDTYGVAVLDEIVVEKRQAFDTKITLNLGGFVIPALILSYLLITQPNTVALEVMLIMIVAVSLLAEMVSGIGIVIPDYIGLISIPFALILAPQNAAIVIFVSSIGGILIGSCTTLLTFDREKKGSAYINLGGIGGFRAIYISALVAGLTSYFI